MPTLADRLSRVRARIADAAGTAGRDPGDVTLIAVSKRRRADEVAALNDLGQRAFGESYLQEALDKQQALAGRPIDWHFIGPLQANKTRGVAAHFAWVHSLDRVKLARRLNDQRPDGLPPLEVCLQVNISGEASKSGVAPAALRDLALSVADLPRLRLRGLMAIPAPASDPGAARRPFRDLRGLAEELGEEGLVLDTLSMGMSDDLEAAVLEGATHVRVGTALFGPRP
ncbi:MAG: YggS family pyridoxal phosphate-dependent enzyme [Gammaproteobacteria bacterium]|nr:YggS family pyridoxal phosphate-dependent enzyme [Gammaproteobacteria bacterium]